MNNRFNSVSEVLDFAIRKEEQAVKFYFEMAQRPIPKEIKKVFEDFALMELRQKETLERVEKGHIRLQNLVIRNLGTEEIAEEAQINENATLTDALVLALKRENEAYRLYIELAAASETKETLDIFALLAQQEASHKLWFETEYKKQAESLVLNN